MIHELTREALIVQIEKLGTEVATIQQQLDTPVPFHNDYKKWRADANFAMSNKKNRLQLMYRELSLRNSKIKADRGIRIERYFVNIARENLAKDLFEYIMSKALEEVKDA